MKPVRVSGWLCFLFSAAILSAGCGAKPDAPQQAYTNIYDAVKAGDLAGVTTFVSEGYDVNLPDDTGMTALHYAAAGGHTEIIKLLVGEGANPGIPNSEGKTALDLGQASGKPEVVTALNSAGAAG